MEFHYTAIAYDEPVVPDRTGVGVWTLPAGESPDQIYVHGGTASYDLDIPAGVADHGERGWTSVFREAELVAVWPHMHLRGKDMAYIVSYPDGTEETILNVPNYDFNWQMEYDFVEPLKVPAGSTLKTIAHYDNSVNNRYNPGPDQDVQWGEQSWDEMFVLFTKYSVDKNDLRLEGKPPAQD